MPRPRPWPSGITVDAWGQYVYQAPGGEPVTAHAYRTLLRVLALYGQLAAARSPTGSHVHVVNVAEGRPFCHAGRGAFHVLEAHKGWQRVPAREPITCPGCLLACRVDGPLSLVA